MARVPIDVGVTDKILNAMQDLLTLKCQTEVGINDASRIGTIKVGLLQDQPTGVVVLLHENDPDDPKQWPHRPLRWQAHRVNELGASLVGDIYDGLGSQIGTPTGYQLVGGGSQMQYSFTIQIEVWGRFQDVDVDRSDVGHIAAVVENRVKLTLHEAGPQIGTGQLISDDFGESVVLGPNWGVSWVEQGEGESLIFRKFLRLFYVATQSWSTADW